MEQQNTKILNNISSIAKAYVRISSVKSALTVLLVGYTTFKVIQSFKE